MGVWSLLPTRRRTARNDSQSFLLIFTRSWKHMQGRPTSGNATRRDLLQRTRRMASRPTGKIPISHRSVFTSGSSS